nr:G-type lectin S-receptor-like serine/threonine-protein kinase At1g67520 [Ipomoea batatas]
MSLVSVAETRRCYAHRRKPLIWGCRTGESHGRASAAGMYRCRSHVGGEGRGCSCLVVHRRRRRRYRRRTEDEDRRGEGAKNTLASEESLVPTDDDYLESSNKLFKLNFVKQPGSAFSCFLSIQWAGYFVTSTSERRTIWVAWLDEAYDFPELIMERDGWLLISDVEHELVVNDGRVGSGMDTIFHFFKSILISGVSLTTMKVILFGMMMRIMYIRILRLSEFMQLGQFLIYLLMSIETTQDLTFTVIVTILVIIPTRGVSDHPNNPIVVLERGSI